MAGRLRSSACAFDHAVTDGEKNVGHGYCLIFFKERMDEKKISYSVNRISGIDYPAIRIFFCYANICGRQRQLRRQYQMDAF